MSSKPKGILTGKQFAKALASGEIHADVGEDQWGGVQVEIVDEDGVVYDRFNESDIEQMCVDYMATNYGDKAHVYPLEE